MGFYRAVHRIQSSRQIYVELDPFGNDPKGFLEMIFLCFFSNSYRLRFFSLFFKIFSGGIYSTRHAL